MSFALHAKHPPIPPPPRLLARHRGISFHEERFSWLRFEAEHLFVAHYREASADLSVPLEINWEFYEKLEQADLTVCVVARAKSGLPVGYAVFVLTPHLHYRMLQGANDVFFLAPEYRRGWLGVKLLRLAEHALKERGVGQIVTPIKLHVRPGKRGTDVGPLFRYLGYRPIEMVYSKRIV